MEHISKVLRNIAEPESFSAQYKDARWREMSKRHLSTNGFCNSCRRRGVKLNAHHINYTPGKKIYEANQHDLVTLCDDCHAQIHNAIKSFRKTISRCNAKQAVRITAILQVMIERHGDDHAAFAMYNALGRMGGK